MLRRPPAPSTSAFSLVGALVVGAFTDMPIWAAVLVFVLAAAIGTLRIVFPQQSQDGVRPR